MNVYSEYVKYEQEYVYHAFIYVYHVYIYTYIMYIYQACTPLTRHVARFFGTFSAVSAQS